MPNIEEVDTRVKEEINKEGFESDSPDSGAAVLIGKKEEMPDLLEKLEKEGSAADLATHIRLCKEIKVPSEEIDPEIQNKTKKGMAWLYNLVGYKGELVPEGTMFNLWFIDSNQNIARSRIRPHLITDKSFMPPEEDINKLLSLQEENRKAYKAGNKQSQIGFADSVKAVHSIDRHMERELEKLGFDFDSQLKLDDDILPQISKYEDRIKRQSLEKAKEEFDF